jgi:UDP-N-acetylmuramyl pentapeptide phosphotransferase/UDP-N-acetylglucosamine-1-phosphate transferase
MGSLNIGFVVIALCISIITQYILIRVSRRNDLLMDDFTLDLPQKMHDVPTPRVGGLGIFIASFLFGIDNRLGLILLGCSIPTFFAGFFEDLFSNLSPKKRLMIMVVSAVLAIYFLEAVVTDFGLFNTPYWIGVLISFIAILALPNGANLIDGFNGLLGFTSLIIFAAFAYVAYMLGDWQICNISAILCAALIGFLLFNYPKGLIFIGDGGAYYIGFVMAVIAMKLAHNHPKDVSPFFILLSISYPVMEVIFSFARRGLKKGANPLDPDTAHFHHIVNQKLAKGDNSKTALYIIPFILVPNVLSCLFYNAQPVLIGGVIGFIMVYLLFYRRLTHKTIVDK